MSIYRIICCGVCPILCALIVIGCNHGKRETSREASAETFSSSDYPPSIDSVFLAHGGYDHWRQMRELQFSLEKGEHQTIDLRSRRLRIDGNERTIGFDGHNVWVLPDSLTEGARFYHNLFFYFYAMPFVLGDPGIHYQDIGERQLFGNTVHGIKISYGSGVGDSPKDNYILYYDPDTHKMEALMYTVTFRTQESSDNFRLIKYDQWQDVNGLLLPEKLQWYQYENDSVGEMRSEMLFSNVSLSDTLTDEELFTMPAGAGIAEMD